MIDRVYKYMSSHHMTEPGCGVVAAVSGGADSMCLLEVLMALQPKLGIRLRVLHVHHGLRESAEGDLRFVREHCRRAAVPFEAVYVDASKYASEEGLSIEEAARHLRYEALRKAAAEWGGSCVIAVAHHMEDQAETVLFNLVRGSRLTGLRGMLPAGGGIIRPLMECTREEIEKFLTERGISWREDETNEDVRYSRNLIRREVMPLLRTVNSGAQEHIARAAEEAAEAEEFLRAQTERVLARARVREGGFAGRALLIDTLLREPPILQRRAVYAMIAEASGGRKDLQNVHVQAVLSLAGRQGNGSADLPGGLRVEKSYGKLCFGGSAGEKSDRRWPAGAGEYRCRVLDFDGDMKTVPRKQCTKWFDYDKIGTFPDFRTRQKGDRITLDDSGRSKSAARYMIDAKIPAGLRETIVLPAAGNEILWIPGGRTNAPAEDAASDLTGGRMSAAFKVGRDTKRILEITWEPEKQ